MGNIEMAPFAHQRVGCKLQRRPSAARREVPSQLIIMELREEQALHIATVVLQYATL